MGQHKIKYPLKRINLGIYKSCLCKDDDSYIISDNFTRIPLRSNSDKKVKEKLELMEKLVRGVLGKTSKMVYNDVGRNRWVRFSIPDDDFTLSELKEINDFYKQLFDSIFNYFLLSDG